MGRPNKYDLDYFPLDVTMFDDHKLVVIEEKMGIKGGYIALRIMAMVYADKGYYLEWPEGFEYTAAKRVGNNVTGALVGEVFELCLQVKLFNRTLFENFRIVSSFGIQKRWKYIMEMMRRKIEVDSSYWLIPSEQIPVSSEETRIDSEESTQKEMKGNEIKGKGIDAADATANPNLISDPDFAKNRSQRSQDARREKFVAPTAQEVIAYFTSTVGNPDNGPAYWPADLCRNEGSQMHDHYTSNGWKQGKGKPIVDWRASCRIWIRNYKKGTFEKPTPVPAEVPKVIDPRPPSRPTLGDKQIEINYLFESFLENKCTVISVEYQHYDFLKARNMISFSDEEVVDITERARKYLMDNSLPMEGAALKIRMKKEGLMEYFKKLKAAGKVSVFKE